MPDTKNYPYLTSIVTVQTGLRVHHADHKKTLWARAAHRLGDSKWPKKYIYEVFMIQKNLSCFHIDQIADSGQCFRMVPYGAGYSVISGSHFLVISQQEQTVTFSCAEEEFSFWEQYFDLETDYQTFIDSVSPEDTYLKQAAKYGSGIRILRQDLWEMILTFIISQQKTIPNIRALVELLSVRYGTRLEIPENLRIPDGPACYYTFPSPQQLSHAALKDLLVLKLGYRAKYIKQVCEDACEGRLDLPRLTCMDYLSALTYLKQFYGIGEKVANCVCLFGLHHIDAFPVDTWIKKILLSQYAPQTRLPEGLAETKVYDLLIQRYFSRYKGFAGVMQQYIFYYERETHAGNLK